MRMISLLAAGALAAGIAPAVAAAPASARACIPFNDISYSQGFVVGSRYVYCNPPGVENPRPVTIQRSSGSSWVTVASDPGFEGSAVYVCSGTANRTYRLKEVPSKTVTAPCG